MRPLAVALLALVACERDVRLANPKRATIVTMLARGPVRVHLDARRPGVVVPPRFRTDNNLVLRYGYALVPPIKDLVLDDDAITGMLKFDGKLFHTVVPWSAVYAAVMENEDTGPIWKPDVPPDLK